MKRSASPARFRLLAPRRFIRLGRSSHPARVPRVDHQRVGSRATVAGVRLPYMPGLDGLRAFAVGAVLLYHAGLPFARGGFLGVEMFFVISGYLITSLLLAEWQATGRIDLAGFWLRRARRLLPALLLVIGAALAYSLVALPQGVAGLRADALAALAYVSNWFFIAEERSYFETAGRPSLLQHLWSLAVEEQFYLLWPVAFALAMRVLRPRYVVAAIVGLAALSTAWMAMLSEPGADPSRVYYGTDTRAAGLLIGAVLAFAWVPGRLPRFASQTPCAVIDAAGIVALVALALAVVALNEFAAMLYQGGFALVALITAVLIAVTVHPETFVGRAVALRPLRWIGVRSYGLYLWHWPVFMLTRPQLDVPFDGPLLLALRLGLTAGLAELSLRCVETPFRNGAFERALYRLRAAAQVRSRATLRPLASASAAVLLLGAFGCAVAVAEPAAAPDYLVVESINTLPALPTATPEAEVGEVAVPTPEPVSPAEPAAETPAPAPEPTPAPSPVPPAVETPAPAPEPPTVPPPAPPAVLPPRPAGAITAVGDSVLLGSARELQAALGGIGIDAAVGRQVPAVIDVFRAQRDAGLLGDTVVVHAGNNGPISPRQFDELMQVLDGVERVVIVNVNVPRPWEATTNAVLADGARRYGNVRLVDWHAASAGHSALFYDDGIHPRPEGQRLYAQLVAAAVGE